PVTKPAPAPLAPRAAEVVFGIGPALVLLAPGLLLVLPWVPLPETAWRTALLFVWLAVALVVAVARASRAAIVLAGLAVLAGLGLWAHPARLLDAVGGTMVLAA